MKTLAGSASKIIVDNRGFVSSKWFRTCKKPQGLLLPSPKKLVDDARFLQHKAVYLLPISALSSSDAQVELEETAVQTHRKYGSNTVHVKFQLQKECLFGEQFLLVGDEPMLGLWDPMSAIPMTWSDEHVWTVELDLPIGRTIQFKFILRDSTGEITWQPGPDRTFQTWESENTTIVFEDWENAEEQKIMEEDSKILVAHNFTQPAELPVSNINTNSVAVDNNVSSSRVPEKPMIVVAENVDCPKDDPVATAINKMIGEKQISQPVDGSVAKQKIKSEVLRGDGGAAGNTGYLKEDPVASESNKMLGEKCISQPEKKFVTNSSAATLHDLVAQNISKNNLISHASKRTLGNKQIIQPAEEPTAIKNKVTRNVVGDNGRSTASENLTSTDVKGSLITHEREAVLIPGLAPSPRSDEEEFEDRDQRSTTVESSVGTHEATNHNFPESGEKQEHDHAGDQCEEKKTEIVQNEERPLDDKLKHTPRVPEQEQPDAMPVGSNVIRSDIQWGRRTLQTLLTNLGLL